MKRKRNGLPTNVAGARKGFSHANTITRALAGAALAEAAIELAADRLEADVESDAKAKARVCNAPASDE